MMLSLVGIIIVDKKFICGISSVLYIVILPINESLNLDQNRTNFRTFFVAFCMLFSFHCCVLLTSNPKIFTLSTKLKPRPNIFSRIFLLVSPIHIMKVLSKLHKGSLPCFFLAQLGCYSIVR